METKTATIIIIFIRLGLKILNSSCGSTKDWILLWTKNNVLNTICIIIKKIEHTLQKVTNLSRLQHSWAKRKRLLQMNFKEYIKRFISVLIISKFFFHFPHFNGNENNQIVSQCKQFHMAFIYFQKENQWQNWQMRRNYTILTFYRTATQ